MVEEFDKTAYQRDYMRGTRHGEKGIPPEEPENTAYMRGYRRSSKNTKKEFDIEKIKSLYQIFLKRAKVWIISAQQAGIPLTSDEKTFLKEIHELVNG